jgi:hypothetical protein
MAEAGAAFVEQYEGQRPLIVTGATAGLPPEAFSRCVGPRQARVIKRRDRSPMASIQLTGSRAHDTRAQLVEEHGMREVAVGKSSSITQKAGTGDEMISLVRVVLSRGLSTCQ